MVVVIGGLFGGVKSVVRRCAVDYFSKQLQSKPRIFRLQSDGLFGGRMEKVQGADVV